MLCIVTFLHTAYVFNEINKLNEFQDGTLHRVTTRVRTQLQADRRSDKRTLSMKTNFIERKINLRLFLHIPASKK